MSNTGRHYNSVTDIPGTRTICWRHLSVALCASLLILIVGGMPTVRAQSEAPLQIPTTGTVTQLYNNLDKMYQSGRHSGADISGYRSIDETNAVVAAAAGKVVYVGHDTNDYGDYVVIYHGLVSGKHVYTLYGHMGNKATGASFISVRPGQDVLAGTPLGRQGNSGFTAGTTGIHLHWEVRTSGSPVLENSTALVWTSSRLGQLSLASPDDYTHLRLTYSDQTGSRDTLLDKSVTAPLYTERPTSARWMPDGSILKEGSTLWLVEGGRRRGFPSADRLTGNDYTFAQAITTSSSSCLGTGDLVNAPPPHRVYRQSGTGDIYLITDRNLKRLFASYAAFRGYGYKDAEVIDFDLGGIQRDASFPDIHTPFREGTLVRRDGSDAVYVVSNGNARLIGDGETFLRLGYRWKDVILLSEAVFNTIGRDDIHPITKSLVDSCDTDAGGAADEFAPNLTINSPADGATTSANQVTVSGTASDAGRGDGGIAQVLVNGVHASSDYAEGTGTAYWSLPVWLSPGANTIRVTASDNSPGHNIATRSVTIYYQSPGPTPTPATGPTFATSASSTPNAASVNQVVTVTTSITITGGAASDAIVDVEIYNTSGQRVFQQFFEHQAFLTGQTRSYSSTWTPTVAGQYKVKIGVFNNTWGVNYSWNDGALAFNVGSTSPAPTTTTYTSDVWWPAEGSQLSGTQPFKAVVNNLAISQYTMYWQVDEGGLVLMSDSAQDYPHKEASVDVSGWNWRGLGPYRVNFVAKDLDGNVIAQRAVTIYVVR